MDSPRRSHNQSANKSLRAIPTSRRISTISSISIIHPEFAFSPRCWERTCPMLTKNMPQYRDCFEQVYRMALAAWQSHTFWLHTRYDEPLHKDVLQSYWHFFYATHESHLTMMVVSLDCLYDTKKPKFHNFETLLKLVAGHIDSETHEAMGRRLKKLQKIAKGIQVLRNNSFGHITDKDVREKAGEKYPLTNETLLQLSFNAVRLATEIGIYLGEKVMADDPGKILDRDLKEVEAIYGALQPKTNGQQDAPSNALSASQPPIYPQPADQLRVKFKRPQSSTEHQVKQASSPK